MGFKLARKYLWRGDPFLTHGIDAAACLIGEPNSSSRKTSAISTAPATIPKNLVTSKWCLHLHRPKSRPAATVSLNFQLSNVELLQSLGESWIETLHLRFCSSNDPIVRFCGNTTRRPTLQFPLANFDWAIPLLHSLH